ncbi:hypothetical protein AMTRI_Chr01g112890 [Amborella trichopoda]
MAIYPTSISPSFCRTRHHPSEPSSFSSGGTPVSIRCTHLSTTSNFRIRAHKTCRARAQRNLGQGGLTAMAKLFSKPSGADGSVSPEEPNELHYLGPAQSRGGRGFPVFVALPLDSVSSDGKMMRRKAMEVSFRALKLAGVEGVAMDVWWGLVERDRPGVYDWRGYREVVEMALRHGLKVRAVMAFHSCVGTEADPCHITLPHWVRQEMERETDSAYTDRQGRRNYDYISLGSDLLPVLRGRSPIQAYSDFMRNFRGTFQQFLGVIITGIQVGMGPAGELRYPSHPSENLSWSSQGIGEFQCYDKHMLASLDACAREIGKEEWGKGGPIDAGSYYQNPEETGFFKSDGTWNTPYGHFFLEWYSGMLLLHGERLCIAAESIFSGTGVKLSAKVGGIHWQYDLKSHPAELTAGYFNTSFRDGYIPIAHMFARHGVSLCCPCFDMSDENAKFFNIHSSPEGFLKQIVFAAKICNIHLTGENSLTKLDESSSKQVLKSSKLYPDGGLDPACSFLFVRMNKNFFLPDNWNRFERLVWHMSDTGNFHARLGNKNTIESRLCSNVAI